MPIMNIIKTMKYYLLTFKALKEQHPLPELYMDFVCYLLKSTKQSVMLENAFETDSQSKLHFHCILKTNYVRFNNFVRYCFENDMYFHFIEIKINELSQVQSYLNKQKLDPIEFEQQQYARIAREKYLFI